MINRLIDGMKNAKRKKIINIMTLSAFLLMTGVWTANARDGYSQESLEPQQSKIRITGTVVDQTGEPVIGANIREKGTTNGTVTDADGKFSLTVSNSAVLQVSFIGFLTQDVTVGNQTELNVTLVEDTQSLDEVVVVGYGTQKRSTLTGSVAAVKSDQLTIAPVGNITNALTGKLPGLITLQSSGLPGSDQASLNIRGFGSPLVIVDGIEAGLTDLDPHQIETVTILKDGAASIYGARAGNGVILVTTKRGVTQKPTIMLNTAYTLQGVTNMAKTLTSGQWAQWEREAHLNAGLPEETAPYTAEEVEKYFAGNDPAYPSSDWYDFVFRDWAPQQNHNLSIRGGSEKIKYMGFFGYQKQETMVRKNGGDYSRFNVQSNVDATITERLTLSVDLMAAFENRKFAGRGLRTGDGVAWQDLYSTRPWYPTTLPDPTKLASGGADVGSVALSTNMDVWGYSMNNNRDLRGSITLSYDVPFIEGLTAKAFVNYLDWQTYGKWFQRPYQWYTYNYAADVYTLAGSLWTAAQSSESIDLNRRVTQQYSLNYDRRFDNVHHLTVLALFESVDYAGNNFWASRRDFLTPAIEQLFAGSAASKDNNGSASETGRASVIGRINYSYGERYLLETILRADASAKFPEEKRWGYFPSISLGWVISQEDFMRDLSALEFLKLRASYGSSGYDAIGDFQYLTGVQISGLYQWGDRFVSGLVPTGLANPLLTWEKMNVYNGGLDFSAPNRKVHGTVEGFYRTRNGIPATRNVSLPSTFGATLPTENLNSLNDRGFELSLGTAKNTKEFMYDISANLSWSRAKWDHYEEPEYADPDQKRLSQNSGRWTDRVVGYVSDGLFTSMEEINALPYTYADLGGSNASLRPGDVKYRDTNGDGTLDWKDWQEIGKGSMPHWFYGLNGSFAYKGFDLVTMFQGAFGYSTWVGSSYNTETSYKLRWTEANNDSHALVPRPGGSGSNGWASDYWIRSTFYLRLKNIALGYTLPKPWTDKVGIEKVRLYVSGTNPVTLSTLSKYYVDPEAPSGSVNKYYPQQRTVSFGLNLNF
jgi:TonB-linked SusC/RagA family outer membrane protein